MKPHIHSQTKKHKLINYSFFTLCLALLLVGSFNSVAHPVNAPDGHSDAVAADHKFHKGWTPEVWRNFLNKKDANNQLPDFSQAGYAMGAKPVPRISGPVFDVTSPAYGAKPDDGIDDTLAIQAAIDAAGLHGGGVVYLPIGRYEIRKDPKIQGLRITKSHIVLRGEGDSESGTILHLNSPAPDGNVRRLGSVPATKAARSAAVVAVMGSENQKPLTRFTKSLNRGESIVSVEDSTHLRAGQVVSITLRDPLIDPDRPDPQKADIPVQLTQPFNLTPDQTDTFGKAGQYYTWIVRIKEIIDGQTIRFHKGARFDQHLRYEPQIYTFSGVVGVGVERLRIESSWPGNYQHHKAYKDQNGKIIRTAKEQDYLWNGIWVSYAVDSWVSEITFKDLTQGIIVSHSADSSLQHINFIGIEGHAGVTIGRSNGILLSQANFYARLVHPVTLSMMASGNVVTDSATHYNGRNDNSGTDAVIDFHGLFPFENLFDNLQGFYVCPGGDLSVLPHAGVRNVFWNVVAPAQMSCYGGAKDDEFVRTYATGSTSSKSSKTMFEHLPQAFYIGLTRKGGRDLTIGQSSQDRQDRWHTIEGLNRQGISISSLYRAQCANRYK